MIKQTGLAGLAGDALVNKAKATDHRGGLEALIADYAQFKSELTPEAGQRLDQFLLENGTFQFRVRKLLTEVEQANAGMAQTLREKLPMSPDKVPEPASPFAALVSPKQPLSRDELLAPYRLRDWTPAAAEHALEFCGKLLDGKIALQPDALKFEGRREIHLDMVAHEVAENVRRMARSIGYLKDVDPEAVAAQVPMSERWKLDVSPDRLEKLQADAAAMLARAREYWIAELKADGVKEPPSKLAGLVESGRLLSKTEQELISQQIRENFSLATVNDAFTLAERQIDRDPGFVRDLLGSIKSRVADAGEVVQHGRQYFSAAYEDTMPWFPLVAAHGDTILARVEQVEAKRIAVSREISDMTGRPYFYLSEKEPDAPKTGAEVIARAERSLEFAARLGKAGNDDSLQILDRMLASYSKYNHYGQPWQPPVADADPNRLAELRRRAVDFVFELAPTMKNHYWTIHALEEIVKDKDMPPADRNRAAGMILDIAEGGMSRAHPYTGSLKYQFARDNTLSQEVRDRAK